MMAITLLDGKFNEIQRTAMRNRLNDMDIFHILNEVDILIICREFVSRIFKQASVKIIIIF